MHNPAVPLSYNRWHHLGCLAEDGVNTNPIEEEKPARVETNDSCTDEMGCWTLDVSYALLWCSNIFSCFHTKPDWTWSKPALLIAFQTLFPFLFFHYVTDVSMVTRAESENAAVAKTFDVLGNNLPKLNKLIGWFQCACSFGFILPKVQKKV